MQEDALAFSTDLRSSNGMRDFRTEHLDLSAVRIADQVSDHLRVVRPAVHHGQQDAVNLKLRIDLTPYLGNGLKQLLKAFR